ncbi:MAG: hypothetical protein R2865_12830 [Deinococcales bacterium]
MSESLIARAKKEVAGALLCHPDGRVLLHHRDDKPNIAAPNKWALFGGARALATSMSPSLRELEEELTFKARHYQPFLELHNPTTIFYLYLAKIDQALNELELLEGQGMNYFDPQNALSSLDLAASAKIMLHLWLHYQNYLRT